MAKRKRIVRPTIRKTVKKVQRVRTVSRVDLSRFRKPAFPVTEETKETEQDTGTTTTDNGGDSGSSNTGSGSTSGSSSTSTSTTTQTSNSGSMDGMIGEIRMFGANWAPRNWALCEGQLLAISSNTALFSILGTTYGGDGRTTFALPDLRGRVAIGPGHGPGLSDYRIGQKGGTEHVTLNTTNLPNHNHNAQVPTAEEADEFGSADAVQKIKSNNPGNVSATVQNNGGNIPFNITQPYTAVNFIICLYGIYPSRS